MSPLVLGPTLETERLILRPPIASDLDGWTAFSSNSEAMLFLGGAQTRAVAWRSLATMTGSWVLKGFAMFSVIEKLSGDCIGRIGPWQPESWPGTEVGWGLVRSAWGKGYAVEAASASIDWAFDHLGWTDVIHCIDAQNVNSQKLAERLGSRILRRNVPMPPPNETPVDIWGQSREEWRERNKA